MHSAIIIFLSGLGILGLLFWYLATEIETRKRMVGSILVAGVMVLCLLALRPPSFSTPNPDPDKADIPTLKPGIDLAGGSAFTVEVQPRVEEDGTVVPVSQRAVQQAIKTLEDRLNPDGTKDMLIQGQGTNRITIEMPGISADEAAQTKRRIEKTAKLELRSVHPQSFSLAPQAKSGTVVPGYQYFENTFENEDGEEITEDLLLSRRIAVEGKHVNFASPDTLEKGVVNIRLSGEGGDRMRDLTIKMTPGRDRIAIVLDGVVKSAPVVQEVPLGSNFRITGLDDYQEAEDLSAALMNPLENPLKILEVRQVSARLGSATISQGINAGIAGLGLTLIFVLLYYRTGGLIALLGLSVNILVLFGAMAMFGFTFTLPGIAGIILTIGVAVDANVLIFERLREELAGGKSLKHAIRAAYDKAFSAIFDANITTLITALILFWRASSTVKGFALTLTIGILAAMFAALLVTRVLFLWGAGTEGRESSGFIKKLSFMNLIPERTIDFMGKRSIAFVLSSVLLVGSLGVLGMKGDDSLGVDFAGGAIIKFQIGEEEIADTTVTEAISDLELSKTPIVQNETIPDTGNLVSIRCATEDEQKIVEELRKDIPLLGQTTMKEVVTDNGIKTEVSTYLIEEDRDEVSAALGKEFLVNSLIALGIGLLGIMIYITVRFEFSFAVGAFVALIHDLTICLGIILLAGSELSLIHVGAILTIAGYSINDTIVVFDRIRETLRVKRGEVEHVMNVAINATLSRTLLTSLTTFMAVFVLYIFGGPALKDFSFAIMVGVLVGTYSSIFVASPIVLLWSNKRGSNLRRELLDANLEAAVNPARTQ